MVFKLFFFVIIFFFLELSVRSESCKTSCGDDQIIFPFQLRNQPDEYRCGYPGFDLSCNNKSKTETIITFPSSGDFSIKMIDYYGQYIGVSDPAGCLAKRLLDGFDPSGTPFQQLYLQNFTLLNCSSEVPTLNVIGVISIPCLSSENNYVVTIPVDRPDLFTQFSSCLKIETVSLSMWDKWEYLSEWIWLKWEEPDCKRCLRSGGTCRYKKNTGLDVGCSVVVDQETGSSRISKYVLLFMFLSFLCLSGLVFCIPRMVRHYVHKWRRRTNTEISAGSTIPQATAARKGLDQRTIEMYPTTLIGESLQLPKPNDTTCSICLLEYLAKDTLRTIPSCMHYFHANCIDEWLKRNATCPLCRE